MLTNILTLVVAYLLGSIPFGLIASSCFKGVDPRKHGSGNIGATNVFRTAGKTVGALTLLGDLSKGYLAVFLAVKLSRGAESWGLAAGLLAILGHVYPIFLYFRGGKGVATSLGVFLALQPIVALWTFAVWSLAFLAWRISSLAALLAFAALPMFVFIYQGSVPLFLFALVITSLIYIKHIENIQRLRKGTEGKINTKLS